MEIFYSQNPPSVLSFEWKIFRGKTNIKEDFSNAKVWVFLTGEGGLRPISVTADDGIVKGSILLKEDDELKLGVGIYGLKVIWVKDAHRYIDMETMKTAIDGHDFDVSPAQLLAFNKSNICEISEMFGLTPSAWADTNINNNVTFHLCSSAASYGHDGLSAYERAYMLGLTDLDEISWLKNAEWLANSDRINQLGTRLEEYKAEVANDIKSVSDNADLGVDAYNALIVDGLYAKANDVYTKTDVDNALAQKKSFEVTVVSSLPTASESTMNKLYLVPSSSQSEGNLYDEYITVGTAISGGVHNPADNQYAGGQTPRLAPSVIIGGSSQVSTDSQTIVYGYKWEKVGATSVDLSNYYTKSQVNAMISNVNAFAFILATKDGDNIKVNGTTVTPSADTTGKICIVEGESGYDEYITIQDGSTYSWQKIGNTSVDLSNYYTKTDVDEALEDYASATDLETLQGIVASLQDAIDAIDTSSGGSSTPSSDLTTLQTKVDDLWSAVNGTTLAPYAIKQKVDDIMNFLSGISLRDKFSEYISALNTAISAKQDIISDLASIRSKANSAYQKPSGGIPKMDLVGTVRTSLNKADTAVQPSALDNYYTKTEVDNMQSSGSTILKRGSSNGSIETTYESNDYGTSNAAGEGSFAVGLGVVARDKGSVAAGIETVAGGNASMAVGVSVETNSVGELAIGKFNVPRMNMAFSIGNGQDMSEQKNIFEVMKDGTIYIMMNGTRTSLQSLLGGVSGEDSGGGEHVDPPYYYSEPIGSMDDVPE